MREIKAVFRESLKEVLSNGVKRYTYTPLWGLHIEILELQEETWQNVEVKKSSWVSILELSLGEDFTSEKNSVLKTPLLARTYREGWDNGL